MNKFYTKTCISRLNNPDPNSSYFNIFFYLIEKYDGKFKIFDEYKIDELSSMVFSEKYGEWDPIYGLTVYEENIWKRRSNLQGHHLRYD